jgi:hypothetical protein
MADDKIERHFTAEEMPLMKEALETFVEEIQANPVLDVPIRINLDIVARGPSPGFDTEGNPLLGEITGTFQDKYDLGTVAFAKFIQTNLLATAETITDTANTTHAISANTAATAPLIVAGTTTTAAASNDYKLGGQSSGGSGSVAATVNAWTTTSSTSGNFTVTGTITNTSGGTIAYGEVGIQITASSVAFILAHDAFAALNVSNNGTLAVTYTITFT